MIELFFGTDHDALSKAIEKALRGYEQKGYTKRNISGDDYGVEEIQQELLGEDLFASKKVFVVSDIMRYPVLVDMLCAWPAERHPTKHILWRETSILANDKKNIKKAGIVIYEYKKAKAKDSRIFQLTDHLCSRDVKKMWIQYQTLLDEGISAHQIVGILWWQMKTMLLVALSDHNPGLAPFVYTKTKKAIEKYTLQELHEKIKSLLVVYHRGHSGDDIEILLEKFIVTL